MTRSSFLRSSVAVVGALSIADVIAACGGSSSTNTSDLPAAPTGKEVAGTLDFYGWQGLDFPDATKNWLATNDVKLDAKYIANWQDISTKLKAGQAVDVATGDNAYYKIFEELGVQTQMEDTDLVPNLSKIDQTFVDPFRLDDGSLLAIPQSWGAFGIVYNVDTVQAQPTSWADLLEPEFKGRVGMLDDFTIATNIGALQQGVEDPGSLTSKQLDAALAYVAKFKDQAKAISPTYGDLISLLDNGEVDAVFAGWPALTVFVSEANLGATFPTDQTVSYIGTYWVPDTAQNPGAAYGWMNEVLTPTVQVQVPEALTDAAVLTDVANQLKSKPLYPYDDPAGFFDKHPLYAVPKLKESGDITSFSDWQTAWNEQIKA
jgi:spermidine/putrescine transport system substrate-binding protein